MATPCCLEWANVCHSHGCSWQRTFQTRKRMELPSWQNLCTTCCTGYPLGTSANWSWKSTSNAGMSQIQGDNLQRHRSQGCGTVLLFLPKNPSSQIQRIRTHGQRFWSDSGLTDWSHWAFSPQPRVLLMPQSSWQLLWIGNCPPYTTREWKYHHSYPREKSLSWVWVPYQSSTRLRHFFYGTNHTTISTISLHMLDLPCYIPSTSEWNHLTVEWKTKTTIKKRHQEGLLAGWYPASLGQIGLSILHSSERKAQQCNTCWGILGLEGMEDQEVTWLGLASAWGILISVYQATPFSPSGMLFLEVFCGPCSSSPLPTPRPTLYSNLEVMLSKDTYLLWDPIGKAESVIEHCNTRIPLVASGIPDSPIQVGNGIGHIQHRT